MVKAEIGLRRLAAHQLKLVAKTGRLKPTGAR
jgi:hypothetical protein